MNNDNELVVKELRNIILNKPLSQQFNEHTSSTDDFETLKQGMQYLSTSLSEFNVFLQNLSRGDFDVTPPGRHNFLSGYLKELQSILRHLTWQTGRVADGDYTQHVDNLGDFSMSFNKMVDQLKDREAELKIKSSKLDSSVKLLTSIVEFQDNLVVITDIITREIIYTNNSAKNFFFYPHSNNQEKDTDLLQLLKNIDNIDNGVENCFNYYCDLTDTHFEIKTFPFQWENRDTFIHYLTDITEDNAEKKQLLELSYIDELTKTYNRRFFDEKIDEMLGSNELFSISLIDIDGLKFVNDNFGHLIGDEYISSVVSMINENIYTTDFLFRIGGDEFILILPNCVEQKSAEILTNIYKKILLVEASYPLSISYGLLTILDDNILTKAQLLSEIDNKMYVFKKAYKKERILNNTLNNDSNIDE